MRFPSPLARGRLVQRYKRFLADVTLDSGEAVTAMCPNTGSMASLVTPGVTVWLSRSSNAARKYPLTWEMVEADLGAGPRLVGVNTNLPNGIVAEAIAENRVAELAGYARLAREVKYGRSSRIDILLSDPERGDVHVEIKNVHMMRENGLAEFPDCVTERGRKHLDELAVLAKAGRRAVMMFVIQREDAEVFALARDIDPAYAEAFDRARRAGVEALAYRCRLTPHGVDLDRGVAIETARARVTKSRGSS